MLREFARSRSKNGCESIAFPLISSGIYGYPKDEALSAATSAIGKWLLKNDMDVSLVVFDKEALKLSRKLRGEVEAFISKNYNTFRHEESAKWSFKEAVRRCFLSDSELNEFICESKKKWNRFWKKGEKFYEERLEDLEEQFRAARSHE